MKKEETAKLKTCIEEALRFWNAPSAVYGIVKDGETVLNGAYGMRDVEAGAPADTDTLYMIGSCTKAFTAMLAAKLVDEGRLDWDAPVRHYMPELRFYDSETTENVTMRDLLCHRLGMPRHEFSWYRTAYTRPEIVYNLRYLEPNAPFRSVCQYFNQGFLAAGCVIEKITGRPYEESLNEWIFKPLGMTRTTLQKSVYETDSNAAAPYEADSGGQGRTRKRVEVYRSGAERSGRSTEDPLAPAGMISSTLTDMMKWVRFHLDLGTDGTKQIISRENMAAMHALQILYPESETPEAEKGIASDYGYCLGWESDVYRGHYHVHHSGHIDGFTAVCSFVPDLRLGFVMLVNYGYFPGLYDIEHRVLDAFLGESGTDWTERYKAEESSSDEQSSRRAADVLGPASRALTGVRGLPDYTGIYSRPGYEDIRVAFTDGRLSLLFAGYAFALERYGPESFVFKGPDMDLPGDQPVLFETAGSCINSLSLWLNTEPGTGPVTFFRRSEHEDNGCQI